MCVCVSSDVFALAAAGAVVKLKEREKREEEDNDSRHRGAERAWGGWLKHVAGRYIMALWRVRVCCTIRSGQAGGE